MNKSENEYGALNDLLTLGGDLWADLGPKLTCAEAEVFARFFTAYGRPDTADLLLACHGDADEEGDNHYEKGA